MPPATSRRLRLRKSQTGISEASSHPTPFLLNALLRHCGPSRLYIRLHLRNQLGPREVRIEDVRNDSVVVAVNQPRQVTPVDSGALQRGNGALLFRRVAGCTE